jgi:flagellar basal-body rod protein FlgB
MAIQGITDGGAIPALEAMVQFSGMRQRLIANNVANLDTPGYTPVDADPRAFQAQIARALETASSGGGSKGNGLPLDSRGPLMRRADGSVGLNPSASHENLLFHDGNDRNLERIMQEVSENLLAFRTATELLRNRFRTIDLAIRERF